MWVVVFHDIFLCLQFQMSRLEHLCVQYLEACIGHRNVLAALQNAARLKLDYIKVGFSFIHLEFTHMNREVLWV